MRDTKDPGTLEIRFPVRAGRPALFGQPMTPAERARRYRARRAERRRVARRTPQCATVVGLLDELRGCMAVGSARNVHRILAEIATRYPVR